MHGRHSGPRLVRAVHSPRFTDVTLSPELQAAAAQRLGAAALLLAAFSTALRVVEQLTGMPSVLGEGTRTGLVAATVVMCLALYGAITSRRLEPGPALALGAVFEVVAGLLMSIGFSASSLVSGVEVRGWTPVAVWATLYPLFVADKTRRVLAATLLTAAMDPLGVWINVFAGAPAPGNAALGRMFLPTLIACVLGPLASRVIYGLTVEVKRAREMGSYRLVEKLGQGGMGEVWQAEHRMLARSAAVKLIRPSAVGAGDTSHAHEMLKRFEREAQATAALRSPHTIAVYDYGLAADGTFYYVMELLEGFSLQQLVTRFGPVPPERAVSLLRQACHSLAEAHAAGLVHRDIKPANLFVCRLGLDVDFVKVLDFGLVKMHGARAGGAEALTMEGAFTGTPAFMPPEMALASEPVDGRADIYALGCVAYWLLTGHRVFEGSTAMQMIIDHVRTDPVPPSKRTDQVIPRALERLVMRCLEKEPALRPATVVELAQALAELQIEERWTEPRAREWWRTHHPAAGEENLATLNLDTLPSATRSVVKP